jgi:small-conductance mechanosensitive channel
MSHALLVVCTVVAVVVPPAASPALAQGAGAATASDVVVGEIMRAPVLIDGEQLFLVRGLTTYPAEQRARQIESRIRALAADPAVSPSSITIAAQPAVSWIQGDGHRVMAVLDEDAAIEQVDRAVLAQAYLLRIREAVAAYRAARDAGRLGRHALYAVIATLLLVATGYIGRRLMRRVSDALERRYRARVHDVHIQAFEIVRATQIWHFFSGVLNLAWALGVLAISIGYLRYVLGLFPWTRGISRSLVAIIIAPLRTMAEGFIAEIPDLVFLLVLFFVARYVLKMIRLFFQGIENGTVTIREFDPEWAWPTYRLIRLLAIALAIIVAYPYVPGSQSEAFKGVSLFMGVVFSLGSSSLIGNVIAGYSMTYRRAFRLGDRVQIGNHIGTVERMRLLVTHLRTPKNEEVIVPNSAILGAEVVNYSTLARERGLILHTTVGIGYEIPWRQVEAMLVEAATRTPGLRREPPPFVLQRALGDFAVTYELNAYCDTPDAVLALYAAMHRNILDVFNEFGVQIMTPAYEGDPEQPKVVPKSKWYAAPALRPDKPPAGSTAPVEQDQRQQSPDCQPLLDVFS